MELLITVAVALLNGGYIYYLHRRIRRLDETNRVQAAADRRLVVSALEVGGELRAVAADLKKQEAAASAQREKLIRFLLGIVKDNYPEYAASNRNGNGRGKTVPLRQVNSQEDDEKTWAV